MIFLKSDRITQDESGYQVNGVLEMHGIKRRMSFPFRVETINDQNTGHKWLDLKGNWDINRKDFNIIWNRYLDHGGILVSDVFTVKWGIRVNLMESSRGSGV
jgi:polyisoprenoid-binding protein YceI